MQREGPRVIFIYLELPTSWGRGFCIMEIDSEASLRVALTNGLNLMLGAGFSVLASDQMGRRLPVASDLAQELRARYSVDAREYLNLDQIYTIIAVKNREDADSYLKSRFTVGAFDERYKALRRIAIRAIYTTNIDNLPQQIYMDDLDHYLNDLASRGPVFRDRAAIELLNLHGSVLDDSRPYRFTTLDVAGSFSANPTYWHDFRQQLDRFPTLFWGYSVQDSAALEALQRREVSNGTHGDNWIVLRPNEEGHPLAEYFRALRFQLIFAETADFLD